MKAVLALGSNLGNRFQILQGAVDVLFDALTWSSSGRRRFTRPTRSAALLARIPTSTPS